MILIVDDKAENLFSLQALLESKSFKVDTALSGEEALVKVLKNDYALIILDVQMPDMDGFEVAETLSGHSKTKDIPIIFLSANNTDKNFITKGYDSGGIDYITKPADPDILLLKVRTFYRLFEQTQFLNEAQKLLTSEIESRKRAQEELNKQVNFLHTILESLPQIAFTADENAHITFVNNKWFNYKASPTGFIDIHPDDRFKVESFLNPALKQVDAVEAEVRIQENESGEFHYHLLHIIPSRDGEKIERWVGTFTDIEDQKRMEGKKDEFLSIASHELKTPLTGIKAYIQLLERTVSSPDNNTNPTYIERAKDEVLKLENLIADLLDISKIENGKLKINKAEMDLEKIVNNAIYTINHTQNSETKIEREGELFENKIYADAIRIEQVLINFLTNALKYAPNTKRVLVKTAVKDDHAYIAVQDFGIGIPAEKQPHIFSKFYRVEESSVKFQGLGLGLYICAEIINQHNGSYGIESEPGKGTTVYFTLPLN